jgi:DNA-binding CsgD family transcriptional regulator
MQESIRVLVVADTVEDTRKLKEVFAQSAGFWLAGSTTTAGLGQLERTAADVFVIRTEEGHRVLVPARAQVLWVGPSPGQSREDSGISAVLSPGASPAQIRAAAAALAVGLRVQDEGARSRFHESECSLVEPLTERELEVLNLLAEGFSNPEIARRIGVSRNTAKFHVSSIIAKLGASSRTEAVAIALRRGLIII